MAPLHRILEWFCPDCSKELKNYADRLRHPTGDDYTCMAMVRGGGVCGARLRRATDTMQAVYRLGGMDALDEYVRTLIKENEEL